jgi:hypothetical protein
MGLYAGAQVDGRLLVERIDENARLNWESVSRAEGLSGQWTPLRPMACVSHVYHTLGACVMITSALRSTGRLNAEGVCQTSKGESNGGRK